MPAYFRSGFTLIFLVFNFVPGFAQDVSENRDKLFCNTSLAYQPRPTFFSIKQNHSAGYFMRQANNADLEIVNNSSTEFNLRAPLVIRPGLKAFASVKYFREDFDFRKPETSELSDALHEKSLSSLSASLYFITPFRGKLFMINRLQASLNGDMYDSDKSNYLNYSWASVLGWRKSEKTILGLGFIYKVDFDGSGVFPLVAFQHQFSPEWSMDALLPAQARVRYYSPNRKNVFEAEAKLNGPKYNINMNFPSGDGEQYIFQRNEIRWSLGYQREIHDWIWFGIEGGYNTPISADWLQVGNTSNSAFNTSFYSNFNTTLSLFFVIPQKLYNKNK